MTTIDELAASIGAVKESIGRIGSNIAHALSRADELRGALSGLGVQDKSRQLDSIERGLESHRRQVADLVDRAERLQARTSALGEDDRGKSGVVPPKRPPPPPVFGNPAYPSHLPHEISRSDLLHVVNGDEGDPERGGHAFGTGRPSKTEFPREWGMDDIEKALRAVATNPDATTLKSGGNFFATGVHRRVTVRAVVGPDGRIKAGWPIEGPGVRRNPPARRS